MRTYRFINSDNEITICATDYDAALDALVASVGGEAEAAEWIYAGE